MAQINLRDIDDDLHRKFKAQATLDGFTMKEKMVRLMELDVEKRIICQPIERNEKKE